MPGSAAQNESTMDSARGIENAEARYREHARSRLTREQLRRKRIGRTDDSEESANDPFYDAANVTDYVQAKAVRVQKARMRSFLSGGAAVKARKLSRISVWMGVSIAAFSYVIQLLFGFLSLVAFWAHDGIQQGWLTKTFLFFTSFFSDVVGPDIAMDVGQALWGCATAVVVLTFLGFYTWYVMTGVNPLRTVISALITIFLLAISLLPVGNLLPGILLWVIYMNATSLVSLFSKQ